MNFFENNPFGEEIFKLRYALDENESWEGACRRVAEHVARAEKPEVFTRWTDEFYDELVNGRFMPGGRIWYGCGRNKAQLINCLSGETEVLTDLGYRKIKDLSGTTCKVVDGKGVWTEARFDCYGTQDLYLIELSKGKSRKSVYGTAEHRWFVLEKGTVVEYITKTLQQGDVLKSVYPTGVKETNGTKVCPFGAAQGLVYGDGSVCTKEGRASASIRLCGDKNHHLQRFFPLNDTSEFEGDVIVGGLPKHWKSKPDMRSSKSFLYGWLAGYFAADGCVDERGTAVLTSCDRASLEVARDVCGVLGIRTNPIRHQDRISNLTEQESRLYVLGIQASSLTDEFFLMPHHRDRREGKAERQDSNWKVVSVTYTGRAEPVYCATVTTTKSFVLSDGLLTGNCFVLPCADSREGWGKLLHDTTVISGTGGGVGTNFSKVRYRGAPIVGTGGTATGAVSPMRMVNAVGEEIKAGGGRRAAYMFALSHTHPDIMEFLSAKLDREQLNNANISVVFVDESPEAFFAKVEEDADHDLVWKGQVVKTIKARELWNLVVENALKNGEPGILNGYLANLMNNLHYYADLECTNPCGEIWMQPYSVCDLGAIVLPRFVKMDSRAKDPLNRIDWDGLHQTVQRSVRFLDDVLDVTYYPIPEVEVESKATRRLGGGVMGVADMLVRLGLRYTSSEALAVVDRIMSFIKNASYDTSTYLAVEKGPFPEFDATEFLKSGFVKTLKPSVRAKIKANGIRNCALNTIAPTGTTSLVQGVWGGIEPFLAPAYLRNFRDGDEIKSEVVVMPIFEEFVRAGLDVSHFEGADEVPVEQHFEMQVVCQRHVDNSISKTVNIRQDKYTPELLSELYMKYVPQLKGVTIYPEGSRDFTPLERLPNEVGVQHVLNNQTVTGMEDNCASGVCGL